MGITDVFKASQFKNEAERLTEENRYLRSLMTPEMQNSINLRNEIQQLNFAKQNAINELEKIKQDCETRKHEISSLDAQIMQKRNALVILDDEALYQDFGLYTPVYNLMNSQAYKDKLAVVREKQKNLIKNNSAAYFPTNFTYNNSLAQGKKLVADNVKQILRAFNNECEAIIDKVKFNNVESIRKRIIKSCEDLNKLNSKMNISISPSYLDLKLQEMNLCYEYAMKKQEEKEEAKRIREEQKEAQKLQREIEEARKTSEKERSHYKNALRRIETQMQHVSGTELAMLEERRTEIQQQISSIEEELRQIDYREANQRAGYVYIISNIGSFGKDIYKIGMTRRLDPTDRVDELGDASVPFRFDIHAMIFSDDAPALEAALHRAFDNKKVNMVNTRREFFHVTLEEIEEVVRKNFDKTVEFTKIPSAEQYRESQIIRRNLGLEELSYAEADSLLYSPAPNIENTVSAPPVQLDPSKEYLHTKWGIYEMPEPYTIKLTYGPR
jgi:T5orf172 domain.